MGKRNFCFHCTYQQQRRRQQQLQQQQLRQRDEIELEFIVEARNAPVKPLLTLQCDQRQPNCAELNRAEPQRAKLRAAAQNFKKQLKNLNLKPKNKDPKKAWVIKIRLQYYRVGVAKKRKEKDMHKVLPSRTQRNRQRNQCCNALQEKVELVRRRNYRDYI